MPTAGKGRLRRIGSRPAIVLLVILAAQVLTLVALGFLAPASSYSVDQSGVRRALTLQALYESANGSQSSRSLATNRLREIQTRFHDLSPEEAQLFDHYLAYPNPTEAQLLFDIFDAKTKAYQDQSERSRDLMRACALAIAIVALIGFLAFWFFVVKPARREWEREYAALDARRERYEAVFTESPDAMAVYDVDGTVRRANASAVMLFGPPKGERVHWTDHFASKDHSSIAVNFNRALSGASSEFEATLVTSRGMPIAVLCTLAPIRVGGEVQGVVGTARDMSEIHAAEDRLAKSEARFRSMFDFHAEGVVALAPGGRITRVNVAFESLSGYRTEEIVGKNVSVLAADEDRDAKTGFAGSFSADERRELDATLRRSDGKVTPTVVNAIAMRSGESIEGTYLIVRDVAAERELAERERLQRDRLQTLAQLVPTYARNVDEQLKNTLAFAAQSLGMQAAAIGIVAENAIRIAFAQGDGYQAGDVFDLESSFSRHMYGSRSVLAIADTDEEPWRSSLARRAHATWRSYIGTTIFINGVPSGMVTFLSPTPRTRPFDAADSDFVSIVASQLGVSLARRSRETELASFAFHDALTGLPNRRMMSEQLKTSLARIGRFGGSVSVHFIDLDGFKPVNDQYGHAAGDEVLRIIGARLRSLLRDTDSIARLGGDEFVVMQEGGASEQEASALAGRIIRTIQEPIFIDERFVHLNASIGIARAPLDGTLAETILEVADQAMYRAKRAGGGAIRFAEALPEEPVRQP